MGAPAVFPFRAKLTVLGALLTIVPLTALGYALMSKASETVRTMTREYQLSVAGDLSRTIESELGDAENALETVGRVLTNIDLPESVAIQLAINLVAAHESIDQVGVYALDGQLVDVIREVSAQDVKPPERLSEDIREAAQVAEVLEAAPAAGGARPHTGVAEAVVGSALLRVREDRVGLGGVLETVLGRGVVRIAVRMIPHGHSAIGRFESGFVGVSRDAQNLVVVALGQVEREPREGLRGGTVPPGC